MSGGVAARVERLRAQEAEAVSPDAIERALAALWREAGEATVGHQAVTRACLWNVIAHVEERPGAEGAAGAPALVKALERLPLFLANRTLILRTRPDDAGRPALSAYVSANCLVAEGGGKLVCSEEVTVTAGPDALVHLPGLVRALLVPGVPVALVLPGAPALSAPWLRDLVALSDRVITDLDTSPRPDALAETRLALVEPAMRGMDLGWLRRSALRREIAAMFDPPAPPARSVTQVDLHVPATERSTGRLLLGWLASALGAGPPAREGPGRWRAERRGGAALALSLEDEPATGGGGLSVRFLTAGGEALVRCGDRLTSTAGHCPDVDRPANGETREARVARALRTRAEDAGYLAALSYAEAL